MLSLRPNMWLREGGVSAHCEAGRRLFCCGPLRGGHFRIVLVYILVSVIYIFFDYFVDRGSNAIPFIYVRVRVCAWPWRMGHG